MTTQEITLDPMDTNHNDRRDDAPEDSSAPSNGMRNTVDDVLATIKEAQLEPSDVDVHEVDDADSALADAPAPSGRLDKIRAELQAAGLSTEQIEKVVAIKMVTKKGQRVLPLNVFATSSAMIAFFSSRTDEQIEADMIKAIRNDGGPYGPAGMYERLLVEHGVAGDVAAQVAEALVIKVGHRITAIRMNVVATTNELRRRRAIAAGVSPATVKYLRVR